MARIRHFGTAVFFATLLSIAVAARAETEALPAKIRDLTTVEGVRDNPLVGYGMVIGLAGTGDRQQTVFTTQTLANVLERLGARIPPSTIQVRNVAAVMVTTNLPSFARPGTPVDVTVSSIGDAKSLEGGLLLLTPLLAADGQVYAAAQGPVVVGGYSAGGAGNTKQLNHPTVGRIPGGGRIERSLTFNFEQLVPIALLLREPDFSTASEISEAINREFGHSVATARDGGRVEVNSAVTGLANLTTVMAKVENLTVIVHRRARVVINERTGTVVMGKEVRLGAVSILHGGFSVEISTEYSVSQPESFSQGKTQVVGQPEVKTKELTARRVEVGEGANVDQLVNGLQSMGATARDVISILQAIKAAGALDAELEVI